MNDATLSATYLTTDQHHSLDQLAARQPDAKVVGWFRDGPVIRYPSGQERNIRSNGGATPCKGWNKGATK
jgi:hypothetical protein